MAFTATAAASRSLRLLPLQHNATVDIIDQNLFFVSVSLYVE